jgi:hypothetical protein
MMVFAPAVEVLLETSKADQIIYWLQQFDQMAQSIKHLSEQGEMLKQQLKMTTSNWENITDVKSFDDFMDWYNRQLYLERRAEAEFNGLGVTIGKKNYKITDIHGMAYGLKDTFVDYWDKEFTDVQRREMWMNLGLTPANYAYVQTWKEREKELAKKFITAIKIKNGEYMKEMDLNKDAMSQLKKEASLPPEAQMGEKGLSALAAEVAIRTNKAINDLDMRMAENQEMQAIQMYKENTPVDEPAVSDDFANNKTYFEPLR